MNKKWYVRAIAITVAALMLLGAVSTILYFIFA